MKFKRGIPNEVGHIWYVDKSYPIPLIGFVQCGQFFDRRNVKVDALVADRHYRFGDMIFQPPCSENEVED